MDWNGPAAIRPNNNTASPSIIGINGPNPSRTHPKMKKTGTSTQPIHSHPPPCACIARGINTGINGPNSPHPHQTTTTCIAASQEEGEKDSNQDPALVKALLALHDKFVAVVNEQFEKNSLFHKVRWKWVSMRVGCRGMRLIFNTTDHDPTDKMSTALQPGIPPQTHPHHHRPPDKSNPASSHPISPTPTQALKEASDNSNPPSYPTPPPPRQIITRR